MKIDIKTSIVFYMIGILSIILTSCSGEEPEVSDDNIPEVVENENLNKDLFSTFEEVMAYYSDYCAKFVEQYGEMFGSEWLEPWVLDMSTQDKRYMYPKLNYTVPAKGGVFRFYFGPKYVVKLRSAFVWNTQDYLESGLYLLDGYYYEDWSHPNLIDVTTPSYLEDHPDMPIMSTSIQIDPENGRYVEFIFPENKSGKERWMVYAPLTSCVYSISANGMYYQVKFRFTQAK